MSAPTPFDLICLGGGSGGIATAVRAARHGARCAVVESHRLGGTCVNVGCVPKKVMWNAASLAEASHHRQYYGLPAGAGDINWSHLVAQRDAYVERLNGLYEKRFSQHEITWLQGHAEFIDPQTIRVGEQTYRAKHCVIAVGGAPRLPSIPGAELGITSDGFFELSRQPKRVAVVGGGYIGVEIAGVLHALGSEVHLVVRRDRPLQRFDSSISETLLEVMRAQGIHVHAQAEPTSLQEVNGGKYRLSCTGQTLGDLDCVIWAVGRTPRTAELNLSAAQISVDERGAIPVDEYQNTSQPGIYAIGDVIGHDELTPVAIAAGRHLADRLFAGKAESRLEYDLIPSVVFSHPPVASIGLSEEQAHARYGDTITVHRARFTNMYYALMPEAEKQPTMMKLLTVGDEQRIIGWHMLGMGADEMAQGFAVAIKMGATKADFDRTVAIHPTSAEEWVTM